MNDSHYCDYNLIKFLTANFISVILFPLAAKVMPSDRINIFICKKSWYFFALLPNGKIPARYNEQMCRHFSIMTMRNVNYNFSVLTFAFSLPCERANAHKLYFVTTICVYLQTSVDTRPRRAQCAHTLIVGMADETLSRIYSHIMEQIV